MTSRPTEALATFAAGLRFERIPEAVLRRTEDLFLDWLGSALAGKGARPVEAIATVARLMGPASGPSEILISRGTSSPAFAAMVNAAASHFAEQDDVHNGSVFHPAAVVFPAALATAQALGSSGAALLAASVAGYEVGIRIGEFLGRSHYKVFHTTGTAGTLAAAAAAGQAARPLAGADAARIRLGGHAGRGPLGVPARRRRFEAAAHRACGVDRADVGVPGEGRPDRGAADPRRTAGPRRGHVERRRSGAASSTGSASAGPSPRRRSSTTRRAGTRIPPPTRCSRCCARHCRAAPARSSA
jgi:hypothetical protein